MRTYHWFCPTCGAKVEIDRAGELFCPGSGEARFSQRNGVMTHEIKCDNCGAFWMLAISPMRVPINMDEEIDLFEDDTTQNSQGTSNSERTELHLVKTVAGKHQN